MRRGVINAVLRVCVLLFGLLAAGTQPVAARTLGENDIARTCYAGGAIDESLAAIISDGERWKCNVFEEDITPERLLISYELTADASQPESFKLRRSRLETPLIPLPSNPAVQFPIAARTPFDVPPPAPPSCTTHVCVCDADGNVVSLTHTLGTGAGVVTPGLGFVWNNSMKLFDPLPGRANSMAPGKARTTGMVPTIVHRDGRPWLVVGAPGGSVIISSVLQTILNVVDFGMSPAEAVAATRIHCEGRAVHAEARMPDAVKRGLEGLGHTVRRSPVSYDPYMSRAHCIAIDDARDARWRGGADPRGGGGVAQTL